LFTDVHRTTENPTEIHVQDTPMGSNPLKTIRKTFVDSIGIRATHALEAGVVLFFIVGSAMYFPDIARLFAALYGIEKVLKKLRNGEFSEKNLYSILKAIVPKTHLQHIRTQPIYFIAGSIIGIVLTYGPAILTGKVFLPV